MNLGELMQAAQITVPYGELTHGELLLVGVNVCMKTCTRNGADYTYYVVLSSNNPDMVGQLFTMPPQDDVVVLKVETQADFSYMTPEEYEG